MKLVKKQKDGSITTLDTTQTKKQNIYKNWKVLVVDDEPDVHSMTQLALKDFEYEGRILQILQAHSEQEAREILKKESDIAVALVDIVMETDDAGLNLINYIRDELEDSLIRIVVRTGQPGMFSEKEIIEQYDIDAYKNKAELSADRLYFTVRLLLKIYRHLLLLEKTISERTKQLQQQNQRLKALHKEKNEFLGIAVHDLKNPLQSIQSATDIIELAINKDGGKDDVIEFTNMIRRNSKRMSDLISNFLGVNAIESGQFKIEFQTINILYTLQKVIGESIEKARAKAISIHFDPQDSDYTVDTDQNILYQILDNLVSNAVKYSPFEKHIFVRILKQETVIRIEIEAKVLV